jgi:hypothetical protein
MSKTKRSLNDIIESSIKNIEDDRSTAEMLLADLVVYMKKTGDAAHAASGHIASQYLETLQRSNEQLVKIAGIIQKNEGNSERGMSEMEKSSLFDMIKEK